MSVEQEECEDSKDCYSFKYNVGGLKCASCVAAIEAAIGAQVTDCIGCRVNVVEGTVIVECIKNEDEHALKARIGAIIQSKGFSVSCNAGWRGNLLANQSQSLMEYKKRSANLLWTVAFTIPIIAAKVLSLLSVISNFSNNWISCAVSVPLCVFVAYTMMGHDRSYMESFVAMATLLILFYSQWSLILDFGQSEFDCGAFLILFYALGKYLEEIIRQQVIKESGDISSMLPPECEYRKNDGSVLSTSEIKVGHEIELKRGCIVPADGTIVAATDLSIDMSNITGEPKPKHMKENDVTNAGTEVLTGIGWMKVDRSLENSLVGQLAKHVDEASARKPRLQLYADSIAGVFYYCSTLLCFLTFTIWMIISIVSGTDLLIGLQTSVMYAICVFTASCPCALSLGAPLAIAVGRKVARRKGFLLSDAASGIEDSSKIDTVIFDKTGTLTTGQPAIFFHWSGKSSKYTPTELKGMVYHMELPHQDRHPLAFALVQYCREDAKRSLWMLKELKEADISQGRGLMANFEHAYSRIKCKVMIGNRRLMKLQGVDGDATATTEDSTIWAAIDGVLVGYFQCKDEVRPEVFQVLTSIKFLNPRMQIGILSGDKQEAVEGVCKKLGTSLFAFALGDLDPMQKAQKVRDLKSRNRRIAFIGDGLNDTLAMAESSFSVSLPRGRYMSIPNTTIHLLRADLNLVIESLQFARRTSRQIYMNFFWAAVYNALVIPLASGLLQPMGVGPMYPAMGPALMTLSTLSIMASTCTLFI